MRPLRTANGLRATCAAGAVPLSGMSNLASVSFQRARMVLRNESISRYSTICEFFQNISSPSASSSSSPGPSTHAYSTCAVARPTLSRRMNTSFPSGRLFHSSTCQQGDNGQKAQRTSHSEPTNSPPESKRPERPGPGPGDKETINDFNHLQNYSQFFRQLVQSVPHLTRPTRDDLLNVTSSFWKRLRIRFKWLTIRSFRKFNADDISAFFSFALVGNTLWILIGTTTFFSVIIATMNSLRLQGYVARAISDYLTHETGITIIFESAIVPKWKGSQISFKNVFISRRPREADDSLSRAEMGKRAAARFDVGHGPAIFHDEDDPYLLPTEPIYKNANYSMFDLNVDSIDVTLSLTRWLDGKGLVKDAEVKGVRGVLDRRSVTYDPDKPLNPADFRQIAKPGDFHLESLKLEDVLVTVYQPNGFRPYTASIFHADLRCLRKQWFCYDFLRAENIVGQIDNCLFSLHTPQSIGNTVEADTKDTPWERMARFRIDGLNVDHLQAATGIGSGPISWITSGKVDTVFDFKFPSEPSEDFDINAIMSEIAANLSTLKNTDRLPGQRVLAKPALTAPSDDETEDPTRDVSVDIDLRFRDVRAAVPLFTNDLSSVNNALIRPIVAFMNANRTLIPIRCHVTKDRSEFDGAWTLWETGLLDSMALKTYEALAFHVTRANMNRRIRTVSLWSLQQTSKAVVGALRVAIEPLASQMRFMPG